MAWSNQIYFYVEQLTVAVAYQYQYIFYTRDKDNTVLSLYVCQKCFARKKNQ